jgi:tetratricopeptide (TPR) repeat protein
VVLALLVILGVVGWTQRMTIARWTGGRIFGYRAEVIPAGELDGEVAPPGRAETERFITYAGQLQRDGEKRLNRDQKELYRELGALLRLLTDCADGKVSPDLDTIQAEFETRLAAAETGRGMPDDLLAGIFSAAAVYAAEPGGADRTNYLAAMLKDTASGLFIMGQYDMSLAMAALAAAENPEDAGTVSLLGNILKQGGQPETAYGMLQYALKNDPDHEPALMTLGMLCIDMGKYDEAAACFNRALRITGGTGPANQGWMLLSLAQGDLRSGYLYMLEGARDGYTHTITEVYDAFKARSDYMDIAGPIFDQYELKYLVQFRRTQAVFDATLDTVAQQVVIDRKMTLAHDAGGAMLAQAVNLMEGKRYLEELTALLVNNFAGYLSTFGDEFAQIQGLLTNPGAQKVLEGDMSGLWELAQGFGGGQGAEPDNVYSYSWEQEVFFLSILEDYFKYELDKNEKEYWDKALALVESDLPGSPFYEYAQTWQEYMAEVEAMIARQEANPQSLAAMLESLMWMVNNFETNGHGLWDAKYTREQFDNLNRGIVPIYTLLEKGYQEQAILCEEYYLYTNNILGYISNNDIYNEWRFYQQMNIQFALYVYPVTGCAYNQMLAIGATVVWGGAAPMGSAAIHVPDTPVFPITGMGSPTGEPEIIIEIHPPSTPQLRGVVDGLIEEARADAGFAAEDPNQPLPKPEDLIIQIGGGKPVSKTTTEITQEEPVKATVGVKLGKFFELSIDSKTGEATIGADISVFGFKASVNPVSGDATLYGRTGLSFDAAVSAGNVGFNAGGVNAGFYAKGTLNLFSQEITAAETGAEMGASILGFGVSSELAKDWSTGVTKDTASKIVEGVKTTIKTETKPQ